MSRLDSLSAAREYIRRVFGQEDAVLAAVGKELPEEEQRMQIAPEEGRLLQMLVRMINAKKIVEIGVLHGYSTIWMAKGMAEGGKIYALDKNYKRWGPARRNFAACGVADKIELMEGEALESLAALEAKAPFDMVFIDADKGNYGNYLDWAEKNVRKGGLIVGDNTFLFGTVYGEVVRDINPDAITTMQSFNRRLADPARYSSILLPTPEGMTVAVKGF